MASDTADNLEQKKKELKAELYNIQDELDTSVTKIRNDVSKKLDPKSVIQDYPLPVVGGAVIVGFLLGHSKKQRTDSPAPKADTRGGVSATLINELKRLATKKAINFATDFVEKKLDEKAEEWKDNANGEME